MPDRLDKAALNRRNPPGGESEDCALRGMAHFATEIEEKVKIPAELDIIDPGFPAFAKRVEVMLQKAGKMMGRPFSGVGMDMGSGTGAGAALLSKIPSVAQVYALEISPEFVERVMPLVFAKIKANNEKIIRMVGNFNDIKLEDNSLDFALEIGAFHHSNDIEKTVQEAHRLLKPDGWLVLIERARPDSCDAGGLEYLLNIEFSGIFKKRYGIPLSQRVTRGDWGEHEYRLREWTSILNHHGFQVSIYQTAGLKLNRIISKFCQYILAFIRHPGLKKKIYKIQYHYRLQQAGCQALFACRKI